MTTGNSWLNVNDKTNAGKVITQTIADVAKVRNLTKTTINETLLSINNLLSPLSLQQLRLEKQSNTLVDSSSKLAFTAQRDQPCGFDTSTLYDALYVRSLSVAPGNVGSVLNGSAQFPFGVGVSFPTGFGSSIAALVNATSCIPAAILTFDANVFSSNIENQTNNVDSSVFSIELENVTVTDLDNSSSITFTLTHLSSVSAARQCYYWDVINSYWSTDGCRTVSSTATSTICECNHFTSFAVLLDVANTAVDNTALTVLSYVGATLSIIGCIIFLTVYILLSKLVTTPALLTMHLAVCLIASNLVSVI